MRIVKDRHKWVRILAMSQGKSFSFKLPLNYVAETLWSTSMTSPPQAWSADLFGLDLSHNLCLVASTESNLEMRRTIKVIGSHPHDMGAFVSCGTRKREEERRRSCADTEETAALSPSEVRVNTADTEACRAELRQLSPLTYWMILPLHNQLSK